MTALLIVTLLIGACGEPTDDNGDPEDDNNDELTLEEEVCLHAAEDVPLGRTASASIDDVDPADQNIGEPHTHFEIELPELDDNGEYAGYMAYDADGGDFGLFTSIDLDVTFYDDNGDELADQPDVDAFDGCVEIEQQHSIELDDALYYVHFGPTSSDSVHTVTERLDHDH